MAAFGRTSRRRLNQVHPLLIHLFERVVADWDCKIITGHRAKAQQARMVREGKSKVSWPRGRHNKTPSLAVDVVPFPVPDWSDRKHFDAFAGYVLGIAAVLDIKIRWGGDWDSDRDLNDQDFDDLIHFELVP